MFSHPSVGSDLRWPQRKWAMYCPSLSWQSDPRGEKEHPSSPPSSAFLGYLPKDTEHSAQHLCGLIYAVLYVARVISQHTLLDNAESPGQILHFLWSLSSWRTSFHPVASEEAPKSVFPTFVFFRSINFFLQRIVRRGAGRNSWERVYPQTEVLPQFPEAQPPLSRSWNTQTDRTHSEKHRHWHLCSIRSTWSRSRRGWLLIPHGTRPGLSWAHISFASSWAEEDTIRRRSTPSGMPYGNNRLDCSWSQTAEALQQCSQNVDVNGSHHGPYQLMASPSLHCHRLVEWGRHNELEASMVGTIYVHVLRTLLCSVPQEIPYTNLHFASLKRKLV